MGDAHHVGVDGKASGITANYSNINGNGINNNNGNAINELTCDSMENLLIIALNNCNDDASIILIYHFI